VKAAMPCEKELYPFKLSSMTEGYDIRCNAAIIDSGLGFLSTIYKNLTDFL
jgi:hypothetical protein